MNVRTIPLELYFKMSEKYCNPGEKTIYNDGCSWKIRKERNGFVFAYSENKLFEPQVETVFAIWHIRDYDLIEDDSVVENEGLAFGDKVRKILEISAGSFQGNPWIIEEALQDKVMIKFIANQLFIGTIMTEIICDIISEANLMAMDPNIEKYTPYEKEKEKV